MNTMNTYVKQYQKSQVETATQEQILIMLYDGAIQFLNKAKKSKKDLDNEGFVRNIENCQNIILEFINSLDMEFGGTFATNIYNLYDYLYRLLASAKISRNENKINEVLKHLTELRDTWVKAIEIAKSEKNNKLIDNEEDDDYKTYVSVHDDKYESGSDDDYEDEDEDYEDEDDEE